MADNIGNKAAHDYHLDIPAAQEGFYVQLLAELKNIYASAEKGEFVIEDGVEDVHSQVELMLTRRLGDIRYGEPEVYKEISLKLEGTREAREKYINEFIAPIVEEFNNRGIKFKVKWRSKTIASILNKMRKKQVEFEEIYDIFAVRFILDSRGPKQPVGTVSTAT